LVTVFDRLKEFRSKVKRDDLRRLFDEVSDLRTHFDTLDKFITALEGIGLLERAGGGASKGAEYDYQFARLYLDGFEIQRVQGEKR